MLRFFFLILMSLSLYACTLQGTPKAEDNSPGKEDMFNSFRKHRALLVVYATQNAALTSKYKSWAESFKERLSGGRRPLKVHIQSDVEVEEAVWKELPSLLVGTPQSNQILGRLSKYLPVNQNQEGFSLMDRKYLDEAQGYQLSFIPNPDSLWTPLSVIAGNSDETVLALLEKLTTGRRFRLWNSLPIQVFQQGERVASADFDKDWNPDSDVYWYFDPDPKSVYEKAGISLYEFSTESSQEDLTQRGEKIFEGLQQLKTFLSYENELPPCEVYLYGSPEMMGMMMGEMKTNHWEAEKHEIHVLLSPYFPEPDLSGGYAWAIHNMMGEASHPILADGLASYFTKNVQNEGYGYWAAKLFRSGDWQPIETLIEGEMRDYESHLVHQALGGSMVDFLIEEWGKEQFLRQYKSWSLSKKELKDLEKKWEQYLQNLAEHHTSRIRKVTLPAYLKGMTFAHEGYSVYNGYGSSLAKKSLTEIRDHHVNFISIVPYSGLRETNIPKPVGLSNHAGSENDVSVVFASKAAQELGIKTMMKPQIWFGRSWPGDLEMENQADWNQFFEHYRRWILHYAILAEKYEFDMLCLGVEFVKSTIQQPEAWTKLAQDMRKIFTGKITYAHNWGEEIENLSPQFAAELDVIGVDCYYPLSDKPQATDEELKKGFATTLKKLEKISKKNGKPIIFTEVGFRSIPQSWMEPHADAKDDQVKEEDQARCYKIVLESMKGQDWQRGLVWWKWPSYMDYGNRSPQSFSPAGKLAAEVLKTYYGNEEIWE